jgi:hypothetical protein
MIPFVCLKNGFKIHSNDYNEMSSLQVPDIDDNVIDAIIAIVTPRTPSGQRDLALLHVLRLLLPPEMEMETMPPSSDQD